VDQVARGAALWTGRRLEPLAEGKAAELLGIQVSANAGPIQDPSATGMADVVEAAGCLSRAQLPHHARCHGHLAGGARLAPLVHDVRLVTRRRSGHLAAPAWVAARSLAGPRVVGGSRARYRALLAPSITSRSRIGDQVPGRSRGPLRCGAGCGAAPCAPARYAGGSTREPCAGWLCPFALRAFVDRWTADPASIAHAELRPFWVSGGSAMDRSSTGRGGCRVIRAGTPSGGQRPGAASRAPRRWRIAGRGSMVRASRRGVKSGRGSGAGDSEPARR